MLAPNTTPDPQGDGSEHRLVTASMYVKCASGRRRRRRRGGAASSARRDCQTAGWCEARSAGADATRDLFVRPHGLRRNVRGAGLACAAPPSALEYKYEQRKTQICNRPVARPVPPSAIAWPYRWLFALTECGEQRSPAARLCARVCTTRTQPRAAHTRAPVRKARFGGRAGRRGGGRGAGAGAGQRPPHTRAPHAHTRAAPRPCVSNERARQPTDSTSLKFASSLIDVALPTGL
ncbi:unnamed protein product [Chrysodeixis includens]|uniref:Uncharacterized protein n=1 Tax=Chrysodeixis includens TaxID=689277 RepID=A0A9N8Q1L8_CHRIL|nr:unnamed protein product [Chrysodeixis includens]